MLYFSEDDYYVSEYEDEPKEITWADILPPSKEEDRSFIQTSEPTESYLWDYGMETYTQDQLQVIIDNTNVHINELINSIQSLVNYRNICYANREDTRPFGPDTLFQIKWCRDYHIQANPMSEASLHIYQEYKECANILLRAYYAARKIRNPEDDEQIPSPKDYETWFNDQTHYELLEKLYYRTINVRDEEEFGVFPRSNN